MRVTERCGTCRKTDGWHGIGGLAPGKAPAFHHVFVATHGKAIKTAEARLAIVKANARASQGV